MRRQVKPGSEKKLKIGIIFTSKISKAVYADILISG